MRQQCGRTRLFDFGWGRVRTHQRLLLELPSARALITASMGIVSTISSPPHCSAWRKWSLPRSTTSNNGESPKTFPFGIRSTGGRPVRFRVNWQLISWRLQSPEVREMSDLTKLATQPETMARTNLRNFPTLHLWDPGDLSRVGTRVLLERNRMAQVFIRQIWSSLRKLANQREIMARMNLLIFPA